MANIFTLNLVGFFVLFGGNLGLELKNRAYDEFVIRVADDVPSDNCRTILDNLQITLTSASQYLFSALDGKAYLRSATVLLPTSWPDSCAPGAVLAGSGETSDMTVLPKTRTRGDLWTQQSLGCGQQGDQIFMAYGNLEKRDDKLARSLVKEFSMYRYGVFEEQGYFNDPIYPLCYFDDKKKEGKLTGCSDLPIDDKGICSGKSTEYNKTLMVDKNARTSLIFSPESPSISMFCDEGNHNRIAPTKQNLICSRRSILDVVLSHDDFNKDNSSDVLDSHQITDTTPLILYKRQKLTRYVIVIENTKDMLQRESWYYLKLVISLWTSATLPNNTELGLVLAENRAVRAFELFYPNLDTDAKTNFYSAIPYTPSDYSKPACLHCGIKEAADMLNERTKRNGAANNVIIVISPGMDYNTELDNVINDVKKSKIKIATINYPNIIRSSSLNLLAESTKGAAYTVFEQKLNVDSTLLTTYFELLHVFSDITKRFYSGNPLDLPVEIHRREITNDGRSSVTGSFMLDQAMGEPSKLNFFTHNVAVPLFKSLRLISPSHKIYSKRNDKYLFFKNILLIANITEPGTWTYTVETYTGNPQPHFLQVLATPKPSLPVLNTNFRVHRKNSESPITLIVEVKLGQMPVLGAKVEVVITKSCHPCNLTHDGITQTFKLDLLDTGSGDPDITKGDGIYTRYFSASQGGVGYYTFEAKISDNGNTAYTWSNSAKILDKPCCGSSVPSAGVQPISPFQRVLPKQTIYVSSQDILAASQAPVGKIGDLKVQIIPQDLKARLMWTAPDMGGNSVSRYEIRYSYLVEDIIDNFEINSIRWEGGQQALPLSPGSETTFNLDFSQTKELLDKPMYFAVKAFPRMTSDVPGTISNWVRVVVPSPPPPPTVPPVYNHNDQSYWPNSNSDGIDTASPTVTKSMAFGIELLLPIIIGFILLVVLMVLYCYFCIKRRSRDDVKKSPKSIQKDKLNGNITIVPSSPQNTHVPAYSPSEMGDPHNVGLPVSNFAYEDENKKRYSLVNQQEQQLIEELKQHQHQLSNTYGGVAVISNSLTRNGQVLSPFNSWSASQLLHEHERRHSPLENGPEDQMSEMMLNNSQMEHMINSQNVEHMGHHMSPQMEHYQTHMAPPVPPLPAFNNGYPVNYNIYGTHQPQNQMYQTIRNDGGTFNTSLQGSMSSVNSGEKKRRNVTMV